MNDSNNNDSNLGSNLFWTVPQTMLKIPRQTVEDLLAKYGFESNDLPEPSRRLEISRACRSVQDRRHKVGRKLAEKVKDDEDGKAYWGILDRVKKGVAKVAFEQTTLVTLDKEKGTYTAEGEHAQEVHDAVDAHTGAVTHEDVAAFLGRVVRRCSGISKRPTGGIYFIPGPYTKQAERAADFMKELGVPGAKLYVEGLHAGVREKEYVAEAFDTHIRKQINESLAAAENIGRSTKCLAKHSSKIRGLDDLVKVYDKLLGEAADFDDLRTDMEDAITEISGKIRDITRTIKSKPLDFDEEIADFAQAILQDAGKSLNYKEIAVEVAKDMEKDSGDLLVPVRDCLNVASRSSKVSIRKVKRGWYEYANN